MRVLGLRMTGAAGTVVERLLGAPISPDLVARSATEGGVPAASGFYAWWTSGWSELGAPVHPHPTESGWSLLYVGISPARASSSASLRGRVLKQHLGGNTGSSTFRLTLAALLREQYAWCPVRRTKKVVLTTEDNAALSRWQQSNLGLTWATCAMPWNIEDEVIMRMQPPLNLASNASHDFFPTVQSARASFRRAAKL